MPSSKRRTISNSGNSAKSRKTGTSRPASTSSRTAPASFEEVFGKETPKNPRADKLRAQLAEATERLMDATRQPVPTVALYRTRALQRLARLRKHCLDLQEAIRHEERATTTTA